VGRRNLQLLVVTAAVVAGVLLLCPGSTESTARHWLHGVEHRQWPGPVIAWCVGAWTVVVGERRGDATLYLGYLLLTVAVVGAVRLC